MGSETRNIDNNVSPPNKNKHSISPYQKQFQLPLNKTSFGKNSFEETLGGGENKDTQTKLKN